MNGQINKCIRWVWLRKDAIVGVFSLSTNEA